MTSLIQLFPFTHVTRRRKPSCFGSNTSFVYPYVRNKCLRLYVSGLYRLSWLREFFIYIFLYIIFYSQSTDDGCIRANHPLEELELAVQIPLAAKGLTNMKNMFVWFTRVTSRSTLNSTHLINKQGNYLALERPFANTTKTSVVYGNYKYSTSGTHLMIRT